MAIPKPDINLFLHMPAEISYKLIDKKGAREYLGSKKRDIHEQDILHLKAAEKIYLEVVELFPRYFRTIECAPDNKLLSINEIAEKIWKIIDIYI